ncbi:MAG: hypothetical protein Q9N67_00440 [Ghiorsea sp.]|nr:hypothetical protein [Ghiorsea sp.]
MQGLRHPVTVKPHVVQKSLQRTVANTPGSQLVPQDNSQRFFAHVAALLKPIALGTQGQHAFVPEEMVIVTEPPAHKRQLTVEPAGSEAGGNQGPIPMTFLGVAIMEPRITGGVYIAAFKSFRLAIFACLLMIDSSNAGIFIKMNGEVIAISCNYTKKYVTYITMIRHTG